MVTILTDGFTLDREATHVLSLGLPQLEVLEVIAFCKYYDIDKLHFQIDSYPASLESLEPLSKCSNLRILSMAVDCGSMPLLPEQWSSRSKVFQGDLRLYNTEGRLCTLCARAYILVLFPRFNFEVDGRRDCALGYTDPYLAWM